MGKYDADLDLSTRNSLSLIVERLRPGTRILELGPANGRLTRHLARGMNCTVDIVEIDAEAGREAAAFADKACLGPVDGNIDSGRWAELLTGREYDYIVCADVLEHLRDPGRVLRDCQRLLKQGGSVVVSVPNIAHNSVIIGLIQSQFEYQSLGLLDNTHIHFFTSQSFRSMVAPLGYQVVLEDAVYVAVPDTELGTDYSQIDRTMARGLKLREDGIVYQWIFELKKREDMGEDQETVKIESWPSYICECFPLEAGEPDFSQSKHCTCGVLPKIHGRLRFDFDLTSFKPLSRLRLDPLNTNCMLRLLNLEMVCENGTRPVWNFAMNGIRSGDLLIFTEEDPQMYFEAEELQGLQRLRGEFEVLAFDDEVIPVMADLASQAGRVPALEQQLTVWQQQLTVWQTEPPLGRKALLKQFVKKCLKKNQ